MENLKSGISIFWFSQNLGGPTLTLVGKTNRGIITNAIIQGDLFGPMLCAKQVDEIGKNVWKTKSIHTNTKER